MKPRQAKGFTLVELLVVITIISMLMALLLPAITSARENGRRATCSNNQRNFSVACMSHETAFKYFPPYAKEIVKGANPVDASWVVQLFPYIERRDLWETWSEPKANNSTNFSVVSLGIEKCPSDPRDGVGFYTAYVINAGMSDGAAVDTSSTALTFNHQSGVLTANRLKVGLDFLSNHDGSQNTLLLAENVDSGVFAVPGGSPPNNVTERNIAMLWDGTPGGANTPLSNANACMAINACIDQRQGATNTDLYARPSSRHPGGVVVSFCDGHQLFLRQDIDYHVYRHMMTPDSRRAGLTDIFDSNVLGP